MGPPRSLVCVAGTTPYTRRAQLGLAVEALVELAGASPLSVRRPLRLMSAWACVAVSKTVGSWLVSRLDEFWYSSVLTGDAGS